MSDQGQGQECFFVFFHSNNSIEGVRIKTRLSHIFMKNELRVYFIRKPHYASFVYVTIPLQSLVTSYLRHLDAVSAKTGLSPCGLDPVFVLKTKPTRWCPRESTQSRSDEISVQLTDFLIILY